MVPCCRLEARSLSSALDHVLWVGGAQGAGKSTAARAFAHRKGLRLYFVDAFTYSHAERAETDPYLAMRAFAAKTMDERWLHPEPEEMVDEFLEYSRERFRMILDDLGGLPTEPAIAAEGPHLLPELVAPLLTRPDAAVWLLPTPRLQRGLLDARPSAGPGHTSDADLVKDKMTRRNELIADRIRSSALEHGLAAVEIDAYEEARDALDQRLVPPESEPAPETVRELRRDENLMVLDQIKRYLASDEGPAEPANLVPLSCECTRLGCVDRVETGLSEYEQLVRDGGFLSAH
jgi:hypothetical protein